MLFAEVIGQTQAKEFLTRAEARGKVSHAYLFRGPGGIGKKTMGFAFAAYLNCRDRKDNDSCGVCPSCKKYASGSHPDFMLIEPDGNFIKIDQVRELKKQLAFPPFESGRRTVLFPDIHLTMRKKEVANSLLKTLEEPPDDTVIILTGDESGGILPTILSRCQKVPFFPLAYELVCGELQTRKAFSEDDARTLAALAEGSLGKALLFAEHDFLQFRRDIIERVATTDINDPESFLSVATAIEEMANLGEYLPDFFDLLQTWIRDLCLIARQGDSQQIINKDVESLSHAFAAKRKFEDFSAMRRALERARREIYHNCNKLLVCEVLVNTLLQPEHYRYSM